MKSELESTVDRLDKRVDEIGTHLTNMDRRLEQIQNAIVGNEQFGTKGIVKRIEEHENYINADKLRWAKVVGVALGGGFLGGVLTDVVINILLK